MKKIYSYAFAASVLMLASCSNETEPIVNNGNAGEVEGGYMAFNICAPSSSTRADGDPTAGGFVAGDPFENYAANGTFLFFNEEGVQSQIPQTVNLDWTDKTSETPAVEKISKAVVVVGGKGNDMKPAKVLVILNDNCGVDWTGLSLTEVLAKTTTSAVDVENKFIMSNASYFDADSEIVTATSLEGQVYESRQAAEASEGVDIYVERLAAKVNVITNGENFKISGTGDFQVKGEDGATVTMNLTPVITGIQIADQAETEKVFKEIKNEWIAKWEDVKDTPNYRANWALTPETAYLNKTYNEYITYLNGNGLDPNGYNFYIKENTPEYGKEVTDELTENRKSSLLLTAQLCYDGDLNKPVEALVRWAGMYYLPEQFKTQAANFVNKYYTVSKETVEGVEVRKATALKPEALAYYTPEEHAKLVAAGSLKQYEMALKLNISENVYTLEPGADKDNLKDGDLIDSSADAVNATLLEETNRCWYWNEGRSYYFLEIGHDGTSDVTKGEDGKFTGTYDFTKGVVRNNVYQITLTSLGGLGVPVYNPDEVIIPQNPDEDLWYIAARINILKWRIVSQNADFNNVPL